MNSVDNWLADRAENPEPEVACVEAPLRMCTEWVDDDGPIVPGTTRYDMDLSELRNPRAVPRDVVCEKICWRFNLPVEDKP